MLARILCTGALMIACTAHVSAREFSFGLWGDMPYAKNGDAGKIDAVLDHMNKSDILFSIYDGDIKDGSSKCTDNIYSDAAKMFNTLKKPVIYVPGDNEWTDCHRSNNGGYDNLERLSYLRKTLFASNMSFGQKTMKLEQQGKPGEAYSENTRFNYGGIIFVGVNMPGSNNNFVKDEKDCTKKSERTKAQCEADNNEYMERDTANLAWLKESFAMARDKKAKGIVVTFQADPGFDLPETEEDDESKQPQFTGYQNFMGELVRETEAYQGQVLLVHGDTHFFKLDKPLYSPSRVLKNLTRLQTFGSPSLHWVRVSVNVNSPEVFTVRPVMVPKN